MMNNQLRYDFLSTTTIKLRIDFLSMMTTKLRFDFLSTMTSELERYQRNKYGDQKSEQQKENTYVFGYML